MRSSKVLACAAFALLLCRPLYPQAGLGSINGTVVDHSGASIPNTAVELTENATQGRRATATNEAGLFTFPSVVVGKYTLRCSHTGFKTTELSNLELNAFQQLSLGRIVLEVGEGPVSSVTVTAEQQLVKDTAVRSETIQARQVAELPIAGRNWPTMLKIVPGAVPLSRLAIAGREYQGGGYGDFRINGKPFNQSAVNLDGGSIVDHGNDQRTTVAPSLESVQEISILTNNFQAEYGSRAGTVINIVTKSGSNQFHGVVYDFLRNEALNANAWADNYLGVPRRRYRYNYFGGNLGGPIKRNKLFFFFNYENFKQDSPANSIPSRTPTAAERGGNFSATLNANGTRPVIYYPGTQFSGTPQPIPNNIIPASLIHPLGKSLMSVYPEVNVPSDPNNNYVLQFQSENPRQSYAGKVDWNVGDRTRAYIRYNDDEGTQINRNLGGINGGNLPFALVRVPRPDRALVASVTHVFTPTLVMEAFGGWTGDYPKWEALEPEKLAKSAWGLEKLPTTYKPVNDLLPGVDTGIYPLYSFDRAPGYSKGTITQFSGTVSWTRGSHVVKFGGHYLYNRIDGTDVSNEKGAFDFKPSAGSAFDTGYGPANMLLGAVSGFTQLQNINRKIAITRDLNFFLQDTWKVKRNLTFDFGMRFYHMPSEYLKEPESTLGAAFLLSRWDPAKAPRLYVPDPKNPSLVIDPARPGEPLSSSASNILRYSIVPGSGDPQNGVVALGTDAGMRDPRAILFAPRGGFAWSPFGNDRTVIRGGFGWSYSRPTIQQAVDPFENGLGAVSNLFQTSFDTMAAPNTISRLAPRTFGTRDEASGALPTIYDFSISVQRELPFQTVAEVAYVGNLQRHQPILFDLNAVLPGTAFRPEYIDPRSTGYNFAGPISASNAGPALAGSNSMDAVVMRPYRGLDTLNLTANVANNVYHALQASANKRFGAGLTLQANYTWSTLETQTENNGLFNYKWKDYAGYQSNTHRRHVFSINYSYDTPELARRIGFGNGFGRRLLNDWRFTHMFSAFTAQDFSPTFTIQQANTATAIDLNRVFLGTTALGPRLALNGDPNALDRDDAHQFNPAALSVPAIFPEGDGTGPRNFISGRGSFSNDMAIVKMIRVTEKHAVELRANFFNPFNQVRRLGVNSQVQYKANGRALSNGFTILNTPEANAQRTPANSTPVQVYNQYRSGVGHVNVTDVEGMRIVELSLRFRF